MGAHARCEGLGEVELFVTSLSVVYWFLKKRGMGVGVDDAGEIQQWHEATTRDDVRPS